MTPPFEDAIELKRTSHGRYLASSARPANATDLSTLPPISGGPIGEVAEKPRKLSKHHRSGSTKRKLLVASSDTRAADNFHRSAHEFQPAIEDFETGDTCCDCSAWSLFVNTVTCCFFPVCLRSCGKKDKKVQRAWREKMALMVIIVFSWVVLAFITFGTNWALCSPTFTRAPVDQPPDYEAWAIKGRWYLIPDYYLQSVHPTAVNYVDGFRRAGYHDVSNVFLNSFDTSACVAAGYNIPPESVCSLVGGYTGACHTTTAAELAPSAMDMDVAYSWELVADRAKEFFVYNGIVLDMTPYFNGGQLIFGAEVQALIQKGLRIDATKLFLANKAGRKAIDCMVAKYRTGYVNKESVGCFAALTFNVIVLIVILSLVCVRFILAVIYSCCIAPRLSRTPDKTKLYTAPGIETNTRKTSEIYSSPRASYMGAFPGGAFSSNSHRSIKAKAFTEAEKFATHVMILVTCYSEDAVGIRGTLESLTATDYPDSQKLIFMVADGIVTGGGNSLSTPDICISLFRQLYESPEPMSYVAIADGTKQHNMAKVYCGYFDHAGHSAPVILIVKCGTPAESKDPKPGNRGKRDSQIILMNFLSKVMFDDRMTPLEYDLFKKIHRICGVTPDKFEIVLMVDADTKVAPDSLPLLINTMKNDPKIMGICGETRIANKTASWVTIIQVYEYFISHQLSKNFESIFGGVTCLPGCFSAYRIKAPKRAGFWVPILANPDIIEDYSQNIVETLHKKNLLLLGEDRFLSTLMLKTFPKRQMMFLPQATCKTVVPDTFSVLLSQRRRWINSTIHNLMELVLVKDLCGTFCFSMQFVVFLELVGTIILPATFVFTVVLIVTIAIPKSDFVRESLVPLTMLLIVLFLSPILIVVMSGRWIYLLWLLVYIFAIPIWNFVLPLYSFWHFDDFSWGKTRLVEGEAKDDHGNKQGEFDSSQIPMKSWFQWEMESRSSNDDSSSFRGSTPQPIYAPTPIYSNATTPLILSHTNSPALRPASPAASYMSFELDDEESYLPMAQTSQTPQTPPSSPTSPLQNRQNRRRDRLHASSKFLIE